MTDILDGSLVDPIYSEPYVIVDEMRTQPVPHRYVHGGFRNTDARFSFYFPPGERYRGRFHHNTYPLATSSDVGPFPLEFSVATGNIGYSFDSGAYYVQTNNGGAFLLGSTDPKLAAYRANAAAAMFSRIVAAEVYGPHRPYGYLYGGSGGAYQTIGAAEQTVGVWDGFMPFVAGCNFATPSNFTVRMHALRVLRRRGKLADIIDAARPGGSGDIYAGLDDEERDALREVTAMGFPVNGWYSHEAMDAGYFANLTGSIPRFDPEYASDFWSKPGYLGADPDGSIRQERFQFATRVTRVIGGDHLQIELAEIPDRDFANAHLELLEGDRAGEGAPIKAIDGKALSFPSTTDPALLAAFQPGTAVRIDNSWPLALQTYHRHQVPPTADFYGWNQFRDEAGKPIYPQRGILVGEPFTVSSAGALLSGRVQAKTLLVQAHMDIDSFAWFADWYRSHVKAAIGPDFGRTFALWFIDRAQHDVPANGLARANAVSAAGALQQGLRDLAAWVEDGIAPPETRYTVSGSQVMLPALAEDRGGPQCVLSVLANGGVRAEVAVGEPVVFSARVDMPRGAGSIVDAAWDFDGSGDFAQTADIARPGASIAVSATHAFDRPGTYFVALRAVSTRDGDPATPYARIENLAHARVVVV